MKNFRNRLKKLEAKPKAAKRIRWENAYCLPQDRIPDGVIDWDSLFVTDEQRTTRVNPIEARLLEELGPVPLNPLPKLVQAIETPVEQPKPDEPLADDEW